MNQKMPLDGPQVRIYLQKYDPVDMDHVPEAQRPKSIMIWKAHHSFCDGVSAGSLILALSKEFDRSYFLPSKELSFFKRILARFLSVLLIPKVLLEQAVSRADENYFAERRRRGLSGLINCCSSYEDI